MTERDDLVETLTRHRGFLLHTARGLTEEQGRTASTVSALTIAGLLKHVADTEEQWMAFAVDGPDTIRWAQLMRPMSVTHQMDSNMRLVDLPIVVEDGVATVSLPTNRNLLPPGPYMLTVTDSRGIPSTAAWVMVG